jgi:hypothetical protein
MNVTNAKRISGANTNQVTGNVDQTGLNHLGDNIQPPGSGANRAMSPFVTGFPPANGKMSAKSFTPAKSRSEFTKQQTKTLKFVTTTFTKISDEIGSQLDKASLHGSKAAIKHFERVSDFIYQIFSQFSKTLMEDFSVERESNNLKLSLEEAAEREASVPEENDDETFGNNDREEPVSVDTKTLHENMQQTRLESPVNSDPNPTNRNSKEQLLQDVPDYDNDYDLSSEDSEVELNKASDNSNSHITTHRRNPDEIGGGENSDIVKVPNAKSDDDLFDRLSQVIEGEEYNNTAANFVNLEPVVATTVIKTAANSANFVNLEPVVATTVIDQYFTDHKAKMSPVLAELKAQKKNNDN